MPGVKLRKRKEGIYETKAVNGGKESLKINILRSCETVYNAEPFTFD